VPFLRVIRDKRGYETTYLMHWYREGSRQHSRILYVFRSPGGVRVGRDPFDPEVLRQIEAQHPDIAFDWKVVRENQQVVEGAPEPRRRRPRQEEAERPLAAAPPPRPAEVPAMPARPPVPARIEGDTPDAQIAFLTEVYPQVRERILLRSHDPARQDALLGLAERLNPATWIDVDQITTGLQQGAEALERLAHVFARRRRRARKKTNAPVGAADAIAATQEVAGPDMPDGDDSAPEAAPETDGAPEPHGTEPDIEESPSR
jgi:hypothetical protein